MCFLFDNKVDKAGLLCNAGMPHFKEHPSQNSFKNKNGSIMALSPYKLWRNSLVYVIPVGCYLYNTNFKNKDINLIQKV